MEQDALHIEQKLKQVPESWRKRLLKFLSNDERFRQLEHMLKSSSLMLEEGGYQMPIRSVDELDAVKQSLEESLEESLLVK